MTDTPAGGFDGYQYLSPIHQKVVDAKRKHGFPIHLPNMEPVINATEVKYIHALFDAVIEHFASIGEKAKREDSIFLLAFDGDRERASIEKLKFLHNVVGCHGQVITYCETLLQRAEKSLPQKPSSMQTSAAVSLK